MLHLADVQKKRERKSERTPPAKRKQPGAPRFRSRAGRGRKHLSLIPPSIISALCFESMRDCDV